MDDLKEKGKIGNQINHGKVIDQDGLFLERTILVLKVRNVAKIL